MTSVDAGAPSWRVTSQQQDMEPVPGGGIERGWRINFVTGNGVNGAVFMPGVTAADETAVRNAIQAEVDAVYRRSNLSG